MRFLEAGKGWPVVLLHAFPLSAEMWRPQLDRVPDGWRVICPEYFESEGKSIDDQARGVLRLLDDLRVDAAVIGGLSMGGYVTLAMYRLAPERFTGMVLADTRPQADTLEGRNGRQQMRMSLQRSGVAAIADQMLQRLLSERARKDERLVGIVRSLIEAVPAPRLDAALQAMTTRPDSSSLLPRVNCPALVVVGEADGVTPPDVAADMQARLPRSTLAVIPGAGHLSNMEAPEGFSQVLENYLRSPL